MGEGGMDSPNKKISRIKETVRRSSRISKQAKPSPGLVAAKKNAMKLSNKKQPEFTFIKDIYQVARDAKGAVRLETGLAYDNRMTEHCCPWDPDHPESPHRLISIYNRCLELGLVERCRVVEPRPASRAILLRAHSAHHVDKLAATQGLSEPSILEQLSSRYDSIFFHPMSYDCSLLAAGAAVSLVEDILKKKIQNGMALIRPPGHHALEEEYNGYCFLNNAVVAAQHALSMGVSRIVIVDWDVHHGQGTQQAFYSDPRVLYFSIHRYEKGEFWPNLRESEFDQVGCGPGAGYNFNVPLNSTGMKDSDYLAVFHQILLKVAYQFQPELVIVSAGYDAAIGCPEGEMEVSPACFAHMTSALMSLASGNVAVLLEGGYCLESLAEGAALTLRALLGDPAPSLGPLPPPCTSMVESVLDVLSVQRHSWSLLDCLGEYNKEGPLYADQEEALWDFGFKPPLHSPKPGFVGGMVEWREVDGERRYPTRESYPLQEPRLRAALLSRIQDLTNSTKLLSATHKVSFVYDIRMMDHRNTAEADHIEKPQRIASIFKMHEEYGLLKRLHMVKSREASEAELLSVHSPAHLANMMALSELTAKQLSDKKNIYQSVYFHPDTYSSAKLAAGSLLQVLDSVLTGESSSGVAVVRPPGHHADIDEPCGFCIFNSVSVAARYATTNYKLKRVLIVDWDVHHGNGTQEIFYEDPSVLYLSVHRFDNGEFFPNSGDGAASLSGRDQGEGFNVNIPWNQSGMGNSEYVAAFHQIVLPIAYQFDPELVLISAGFDAVIGDPLGGCKVTPECFGHMTHWLRQLAGGRVVLALEGGYNVHSTAYSMVMCTKALLGDPLPALRNLGDPVASAVRSLREVAHAQAEYWPALALLRSRLPTRSKNEHGDVSELMERLSVSDSGGREEGGGKKVADQQGSTPPTNPGSSSSDQASSSEPPTQQPSNTLRDYLRANLEALQNEEMFAVVPLRECPHLPSVQPLPSSGIDTSAPCVDCTDISENWVCLTCYQVRCGRYVNEHMLLHSAETEHPLVLSFSDISVWCYPCQAYIDNPVLFPAKNAVHKAKFGGELPWSYGTLQQA